MRGGAARGGTPPAPPSLPPFALGPRLQCIAVDPASAQPPILLHLAQATGAGYRYEELFRSFTQHLCDSVTSEYLFARDFSYDETLCPILFVINFVEVVDSGSS